MVCMFLTTCVSQPHKTVLEKHGKPEDVAPGFKGRKDPLPPAPLTGMYNKSGGKVRLTFKMESDQLWIGTKGKSILPSLLLLWNCMGFLDMQSGQTK